jgi:integrase
MAKIVDVLTDVAVRQAKATDKPRSLFDGRGLFLLVNPNGSKWWRLKYRYEGKAKLMSLGVYPDVGLRQARQRRDEARRLVAAGINPSAQRRAAKAATSDEEGAGTHGESFQAVAREWFELQKPRWVKEHSDTVIQRLEKDVFPWVGNKPIAELNGRELLAVLRLVEARGAKSIAHRLKGIVGQVFRYAIVTDRAERDPSADLRGALAAEDDSHFGAVTKRGEVAALMRGIEGYRGSLVVRCALRFSALVFCRPGEVRKAEWQELDFDEGLWCVPAARMKGRREHVVPLSRQAIALLNELQPLTGNGRYIFPSSRSVARPMSDGTILAAVLTLGYERGRMTAHGFRTVASTLLRESNLWRDEVIEFSLGHKDKNEVRGAYNRAQYLDERRQMYQWWADHLDQLEAGATVLPLRAATGAG